MVSILSLRLLPMRFVPNSVCVPLTAASMLADQHLPHPRPQSCRIARSPNWHPNYPTLLAPATSTLARTLPPGVPISRGVQHILQRCGTATLVDGQSVGRSTSNSPLSLASPSRRWAVPCVFDAIGRG